MMVSWPDEFLAGAPVDERTALIVLTHDVKFDSRCCKSRLQTPAGYIGAMGSRRTHANRIGELRDAPASGRANRTDQRADRARSSGPHARRNRDLDRRRNHCAARGRRGGRLTDNDLPVHNPQAPVVSTTP